MELSAVLSMIFGIVVAWGIPIAIIITLIILFRKINRIEKKLDK